LKLLVNIAKMTAHWINWPSFINPEQLCRSKINSQVKRFSDFRGHKNLSISACQWWSSYVRTGTRSCVI